MKMILAILLVVAAATATPYSGYGSYSATPGASATHGEYKYHGVATATPGGHVSYEHHEMAPVSNVLHGTQKHAGPVHLAPAHHGKPEHHELAHPAHAHHISHGHPASAHPAHPGHGSTEHHAPAHAAHTVHSAGGHHDHAHPTTVGHISHGHHAPSRMTPVVHISHGHDMLTPKTHAVHSLHEHHALVHTTPIQHSARAHTHHDAPQGAHAAHVSESGHKVAAHEAYVPHETYGPSQDAYSHTTYKHHYGPSSAAPHVVPHHEHLETPVKTPAVTIESMRHETDHRGNYNWHYKSGDGSHVHATATHSHSEGSVKRGSYSFYTPDYKHHTVHWEADKNGFRASGDHLPTPHPLPDHIRNSIDFSALPAGHHLLLPHPSSTSSATPKHSQKMYYQY